MVQLLSDCPDSGCDLFEFLSLDPRSSFQRLANAPAGIVNFAAAGVRGSSHRGQDHSGTDVADSPLEGSGLELSVPRQIGERFRDFVRDGVKRLRGAAVSSEHLPASTDITGQSELAWENALLFCQKPI